METSIFQKEHPDGHVALCRDFFFKKKIPTGRADTMFIDGTSTMNTLLAEHYAKYWQVHCAKPHKNPKKDIEYLGRYIKRPAIANSRRVHYNGTALLFKFLNHRNKQTPYIELAPSS